MKVRQVVRPGRLNGKEPDGKEPKRRAGAGRRLPEGIYILPATLIAKAYSNAISSSR
jgi:hypothetical protein